MPSKRAEQVAMILHLLSIVLFGIQWEANALFLASNGAPYKEATTLNANGTQSLRQPQPEETPPLAVSSHSHSVADGRALNNALGSFRLLVVLVRFADHQNRTLPPPSHFQTMCRSDMKRYLGLQSYGQYTLVDCDVTEWMETDNTEAHYAAGLQGFQGASRGSDFFTPVLTELDEMGTNWRFYDMDEDKLLDAVLVIHSGFAAEAGRGQDCDAALPADRIRSQGWRSSSLFQSWKSASGGFRLYGYAVASAFGGVCDLDSYAGLGVPAHELLHTFGTVDLYDQKTGKLGGLGNFDIMSGPYGPKGNINLPGSMSPYSKMRCGWLEPTEITEDGVYELRASNKFPEAYIIKRGFPFDEYLLLENRQPIFFDADLYGDGGLLIYHIDNDKDLQKQAGYPGQQYWPNNGRHYQVALLQADGLYELEKGINNGDAGDFWLPGMRIGPGDITGKHPNTDSYQGGRIARTGIEITVLSMEDGVVTFLVGDVPPKKSPPEKDDRKSKLFDDAASRRGGLGRRRLGLRGMA